MKAFLQRHQDQILGVLSGFDRLRFRGSLRLLQSEGGVATWLERVGVATQDFLAYAEGLTQQMAQSMAKLAGSVGRKVKYLPGVVDKEDLVQEIRQQDGIASNGLIVVLSTLEMGMSYHLLRCKSGFAALKRTPRKCLHYYVYWNDERFGLSQLRLCSWFPFNAHVVLNGREWLARDLDRKGIGYERRDNCFVRVADFAAAQQRLAAQPKLDWIGQLDRVLRRAHPLHGELFRNAAHLDYYWSSEQTEWATDVLFRNPAVLEELYPQLLRHGIDTFQSPDVLRFLGHAVPAHGGVRKNYTGDVVSDLKRRAEGVRIKHRAGKNMIKMYNKEPTVLRVETTLNDGRGLKTYRPPHDDPEGQPEWRDLRKSVVDLPRRAELSQASNDRYLQALSAVSVEAPLRTLLDKLCRPVTVTRRSPESPASPPPPESPPAKSDSAQTRRYRGLRPFDGADVRLLQAVSQGEYLVTGFRNRDVRTTLYGETEDAVARRRDAARVSRQLAMLRAHGLIKKIPRTHRYLLTDAGVQAITAILAARDMPLTRLAAA